jgi:hypothetical protein
VGESRVSRRRLLQVTAAALVSASLGACSLDDAAPPGESAASSTDPSPATESDEAPDATDDADVNLVVAALADEENLLELVAAARADHPDLAPVLDPRIRIQNEHIRVLRDSLTEPPAQPPSTAPRLPRKTGALTPLVTRRLRGTAARRSADCMAAQSGPLARIFASMAASHSVGVTAWSQAT